MFRTILLLLCLLCMACHIAPDGAVPPTAPTASPAPDWDALLKTRTVSLLLPDGVEVVSLYALGFRYDGAIRADEELLMRYADAVAGAYRTPPVDATVTLSDRADEPFVYTDAVDGRTPDRAALLDALRRIDPAKQRQSIPVPFVSDPAAVTRESLAKSHALLAAYTTSFASKTLRKENRVHNIRLAAERIHGTVVAPGEVFSMNRAIGDRTKANGYRLAGAITNGMSVTEYGGGVCQVSTTLFNAVLMADLAVEERYHHSWPMEYAPVGRDATIATGMKDFRFRNTSDAPVTIVASVDEEAMTVTVRLYGQHSDAFAYIEVVSEQLGRLPGKEAEWILDESLPPGTKQVERQARRGRTSVTYLDYYAADGTLIERRTAFTDTYPSIGEIAYVSSDLYYGTFAPEN